MTKEQLEALIEFIRVAADAAVCNGLGRDCMYERVRELDSEDTLRRVMLTPKEKE
jgi:hypothetical protein